MNRPLTLRALVVSAVLALATSSALVATAQAPAPDFAERVINAKSRADHEAIAGQFDKQATADATLAERHRKMAGAYTTAPWAKAGNTVMVQHCKRLVAQYEQSAAMNKDMAKAHRDVAAKLP